MEGLQRVQGVGPIAGLGLGCSDLASGLAAFGVKP